MAPFKPVRHHKQPDAEQVATELGLERLNNLDGRSDR
jgi:hypothetical protein